MRLMVIEKTVYRTGEFLFDEILSFEEIVYRTGEFLLEKTISTFI